MVRRAARGQQRSLAASWPGCPSGFALSSRRSFLLLGRASDTYCSPNQSKSTIWLPVTCTFGIQRETRQENARAGGGAGRRGAGLLYWANLCELRPIKFCTEFVPNSMGSSGFISTKDLGEWNMPGLKEEKYSHQTIQDFTPYSFAFMTITSSLSWFTWKAPLKLLLQLARGLAFNSPGANWKVF